MVILTLNCGSSSAKYQVYDWDNKDVLAVGVVERIGLEYSTIEHKATGKEEYEEKRTLARERLIKVASAMSGEDVPKDAILIGIGGRYEYRNKGIDVFIDSLGKLQAEGWKKRSIQAFIMIPSGHNGPDRALVAKLSDGGSDYSTQVSHYLMGPEYDQVTRRFRELGLNNAISSSIKVYFVPSYLNGDDGVFNMKYYDLLIGMDLALFPSYYEPWGYTPLEALAFRVPTLTTSLAGFGLWVRDHYKGKKHPGITVLDRNDSNFNEVVDGVVARIKEIASLDKAGRKEFAHHVLFLVRRPFQPMR